MRKKLQKVFKSSDSSGQLNAWLPMEDFNSADI